MRGTTLSSILNRAGIKEGAKEIVFFAEDISTEEIRGREVEKALREVYQLMTQCVRRICCLEMNGEPLPHYHGKPVRLLVPGWYGVANVKWLKQIHVQDTRYMGRFMGRDYVTLKRTNVGGIERWVEKFSDNDEFEIGDS